MLKDFGIELTDFDEAIDKTMKWYLACKNGENKL